MVTFFCVLFAYQSLSTSVSCNVGPYGHPVIAPMIVVTEYVKIENPDYYIYIQFKVISQLFHILTHNIHVLDSF